MGVKAPLLILLHIVVKSHTLVAIYLRCMNGNPAIQYRVKGYGV